MSKFALQNIEAVQGKQTFEKLLVDGVAPFDTFEQGLEEQIQIWWKDYYNGRV